MTACAIEPPSTGEDGGAPGTACTLTADGAYAARLALNGDCWFPERWTLDGPEPYAVPLPGNQPEEPGTEVQPMGDGRVLIHRPAERRHVFALLYPTGPGTGELPLGTVECPEPGTRLTLLPPAPGGMRAYAVAVGPRSSVVWQVAGGAFGPEPLTEVPGRCSGGVWLDRAGRLLALDRELGGRTKTVVVDLERGGISPLLQIAEASDDRLLLADLDSGLLLISSDAPSPGQERLGWGVLGSTLPVRFPECLRVPECAVTPFAIQPGQVLMPENCAVALRIDGALGTWVGTWRPAERQVTHFAAPEGWLPGAGLWTRDGSLRLPYATTETPCGVARLTAPRPAPEATAWRAGAARTAAPGNATPAGATQATGPGTATPAGATQATGPGTATPAGSTQATGPGTATPAGSTQAAGPGNPTPTRAAQAAGPETATSTGLTQAGGPGTAAPGGFVLTAGPGNATPARFVRAAGPRNAAPSGSTQAAGPGTAAPTGFALAAGPGNAAPAGLAQVAGPGSPVAGGTVGAGGPWAAAPSGVAEVGGPGDVGLEGPGPDGTAAGAPEASWLPTEPDPPEPAVARPVPLQQAPLGRLVTN
jgi:hypothetical protein